MFRKGMEADCQAVYDLICKLEGVQLPYGRFLEIYRKQLEEKQYYCLVYEYENKVTGVLNLRFEEQLHRAEQVAEILEFVMEPAFRGKGIGKEMFALACRIAGENGCTRLEVASNQNRTDAHRFYVREGMENSHFRFFKPL